MAEFKKSIDFDSQIPTFKVYLRQSQKGNKYFMGELNKKIAITIHPNKSQWAKKGEWQVYFIPINYQKIEEQPQKEQIKKEFDGTDVENIDEAI